VYSGTTKAWTSGVGGVSSIETLMTAINADTTFDPANIKITAAKDANKAKHIKIDFTKGGAVSTTTTAGVITFKFDKEYLTTATIAANSNQDAIATAVTATISATDKYNASATLNTIAINAAIASGSSSGDISPLAAAVPSDFSFVIDAAQTSTTVQFSTTTSNTAGLTANAFHLGSTSWDTVGLRVTIKNESTAVALGTVGLTAVGGAAATTAFANGAGQLLVPGTNMVAKSTSNEAKVEALVAAFSDISDPTTTGSTLNRITWL
jgi:hypothetical protein